MPNKKEYIVISWIFYPRKISAVVKMYRHHVDVKRWLIYIQSNRSIIWLSKNINANSTCGRLCIFFFFFKYRIWSTRQRYNYSYPSISRICSQLSIIVINICFFGLPLLAIDFNCFPWFLGETEVWGLRCPSQYLKCWP